MEDIHQPSGSLNERIVESCEVDPNEISEISAKNRYILDDAETNRYRFQYQIIWLIHAVKCSSQCNIPDCQAMTHVLKHMTVCRAEYRCIVLSCVDARQAIFHWKYCSHVECAQCLPLRLANQSKTMDFELSVESTECVSSNEVSQTNEDFQLSIMTGTSYLMCSAPVQMANSASTLLGSCLQQSFDSSIIRNQNFSSKLIRRWQRPLSITIRYTLMLKIANEIVETCGKHVDENLARVVLDVVTTLENEVYNAANSGFEYYHLLGEGIYNIRQMKNEKQVQKSNSNPKISQQQEVKSLDLITPQNIICESCSSEILEEFSMENSKYFQCVSNNEVAILQVPNPVEVRFGPPESKYRIHDPLDESIVHPKNSLDGEALALVAECLDSFEVSRESIDSLDAEALALLKECLDNLEVSRESIDSLDGEPLALLRECLDSIEVSKESGESVELSKLGKMLNEFNSPKTFRATP